jgi:two-component system chemotaxis response regulator CheB
LVISASVQEEDTQNVFELLRAGAIDVFPKPRTGLAAEYDQIKRDLITKIKVLSGVSVFTQHRHRRESAQSHTQSRSAGIPTGQAEASSPKPAVRPAAVSYAAPIRSAPVDIRTPRVLTIGASTGGPRALQMVLRSLPLSFPVPVLCVQHISDGFLQGLVNWLDQECALPVAIAQANQVPQPGRVYFAPERQHLEITPQGVLRLYEAPAVAGHCPSVTVMFQSVAAYYRRSAVGVLLTGMGRDGADGLLKIAQAGGTTIAQDEATSIVFGMPREAIALGAAQSVLPLSEIAPTLLKRVFAIAK